MPNVHCLSVVPEISDVHFVSVVPETSDVLCMSALDVNNQSGA